MAGILLPSQWTRQPQYPAILKPEYAAVASVVRAQFPIDPQSRKAFANTSLTQIAMQGGNVGWSSDGSVGPRHEAPFVPFATTSSGLAFIVQFRTTNTTTKTPIAGTVNTGSSYLEHLFLNQLSDGTSTLNSGSIQSLVRTTGNVSSSCHITPNPAVNDGAIHTCVFVWDLSGALATARAWVDGVEYAPTFSFVQSAFSQSAGNTDFSYGVNNRNVRNAWTDNSFNGAIPLFVRLLSSKVNGQSLSINPWQIFAPSPRRLWVSVAASGNTGTLATTNANDTLASSGTQTNTGTLAKTNANDTLASSGTQTNTGTLARTNANDSLAASGTAGSITGTLATTNANDALSASGYIQATGTLARTNANDSLSASGTAAGGAVGGYYDTPRKRKYVVRVGDKLMVFNRESDAAKYVPKTEPTTPATIAKVEKKIAPKADEVVSVKAIERAIEAAPAPVKAEAQTYMESRRYEALLRIYEHLQQEEDDLIDLILMAA